MCLKKGMGLKMSTDIEKIKKLNNLVSLSKKIKHTIVLNPDEKSDNIENLDKSITYDKAEWKIDNELSAYVDELSKDESSTTEDKILMLFEKICKDYIYDDNLISYIKKIDDDKFSLPDWYGRDVDNEWEENRENHNRRVCFELSRYLAKSLTELFKDDDSYNICIHWNKDHTHYFVGLTCDDYSVTLDTDDFSNIKDVTRVKAGLTADGIDILEDSKNKFTTAVNKFNNGKAKHAIKKMEDEVNNTETQDSNEIIENEEVAFIKKVIKILSEKYEIDSQGIFEYVKEIADIRLGSEKREKIWKKLEGDTKESTRYIRCLLLNIDEQKFLVDVDKKLVRPFEEEELNKKRAEFIPYNDLSRGGYDYYNGL